MLSDDLVGNVEEPIQGVRPGRIDSQDQEPARFLEVRHPIQTRDGDVETVEISQNSHRAKRTRNKAALRADPGGPDGALSSDDEIVLALRREPNGARQTDVQRHRRREITRQQGVYEAETSWGVAMPRAAITADSDACSAVDGNPRPCQR